MSDSEQATEEVPRMQELDDLDIDNLMNWYGRRGDDIREHIAETRTFQSEEEAADPLATLQKQYGIRVDGFEGAITNEEIAEFILGNVPRPFLERNVITKFTPIDHKIHVYHNQKGIIQHDRIVESSPCKHLCPGYIELVGPFDEDFQPEGRVCSLERITDNPDMIRLITLQSIAHQLTRGWHIGYNPHVADWGNNDLDGEAIESPLFEKPKSLRGVMELAEWIFYQAENEPTTRYSRAHQTNPTTQPTVRGTITELSELGAAYALGHASLDRLERNKLADRKFGDPPASNIPQNYNSWKHWFMDALGQGKTVPVEKH